MPSVNHFVRILYKKGKNMQKGSRAIHGMLFNPQDDPGVLRYTKRRRYESQQPPFCRLLFSAFFHQRFQFILVFPVPNAPGSHYAAICILVQTSDQEHELILGLNVNGIGMNRHGL